MTEEERERLYSRLQRAFGERTIAEAIGPVKAIVGPRNMPGGDGTADRARDKLARKQTPTPTELAALEVMIRLLRPSLLCRAGTLDALPAHNEYGIELRELWEAFRTSLGPRAFSVGRIDSSDHDRLGTGFLVGPDRIVTNHHVLEALSFGTFELERGQGVIHFQQQYGAADTEDAVAITRVIDSDAVLDIALLEIDPPSEAAHPPLAFGDVGPAVGDFVVVLGYPLPDGGRNHLFTDTLFENKYGVKRGAPGEVVSVASSLAFHDCSTLGGNSGSPVVSLRSGKIVALHRSGKFMYRNEAVQVSALQQFVTAH